MNGLVSALYRWLLVSLLVACVGIRAGVYENRGRPEESRQGRAPSAKTLRGQLSGMKSKQRSVGKYQNLDPAKYQSILGGLDHFGLGTLPKSDSIRTRCLSWLSSVGREDKKTKIQERLFAAIREQSGGQDPRETEMSWQQVTFTDEKIYQLNGQRIYEHEFHFPTGILGMQVTGRLFIPDRALHQYAVSKLNPAVIFHHADKDPARMGVEEIKMIGENPILGSRLQQLTSLGFIVIATDVHGFNRRRTTEPGKVNATADEQDDFDDAEKLFALQFSPYAVRSVEDYLVFRLLNQHPMVDPNRVGVLSGENGGLRTLSLTALAGKKMRVAVVHGAIPRFWCAAGRGQMAQYRGNFLFNALADFSLDNEHLIYLATSANLLLQCGESAGALPERLDLAKIALGTATNGAVVRVEVDRLTDLPMSVQQQLHGYSFLAAHLRYLGVTD